MEKNSFKASPFSFDESRPPVYVSAGAGAYDNTRDALSKIDLSVVKGKRVLLKPNAGRIASADSGITTSPLVVAAAIDAFREAGAVVAVGESPITGVKTMEAFEATGIAEIAHERDCPLLDMDIHKPKIVEIKDGIAIQSIKVCPDVFDYDLIVSIPVMKTHMHTGITLSVKNMKGCLWRRTKVDLHMLQRIDGSDEKPLNIAIADMSSVLLPHLAIIDGTVCMEGLGPSAGSTNELDLVVVGFDPFAADSVACSLMGIRAEDISHLRLGADRGYGVIDLSKINISPDSWQGLGKKFELPPENLAIHFPGITILDEQSCSACQSTVLLFLQRYGEKIFEYFPDKKDVVLAIGKGHDSVPAGTVCIGNCTSAHKGEGIYVSGCPPVSSEILKAISGKDSIDEQFQRGIKNMILRNKQYGCQ